MSATTDRNPLNVLAATSPQRSTATTVREPNEAQLSRIEEAVANLAESDFVLEGWRVIDGAEFLDGQEPPSDHLYVEFRYRDPNLAEDLRDRPGREVHVYSPAGAVLDCHDFG